MEPQCGAATRRKRPASRRWSLCSRIRSAPLQELSDLVAGQWTRIDALTREVLRLRDELQTWARAPRPTGRRRITDAEPRDFTAIWRQNSAGLSFEDPDPCPCIKSDPQAGCAHPSGRPQFHHPVRHRALVLHYIWSPLGWIGGDRHGLVRLFLPRSAPRHPDARRSGVAPADGDVCSIGQFPAAGTRARPRTDAARLRLHERVRLPREPRAGTGRITRIAYKPGLFLNADLDKASEDNERNGMLIDAPQGTLRRGADRRADRPPHPQLRPRGPKPRRRRPVRPDSLRLARRRLSCRRARA